MTFYYQDAKNNIWFAMFFCQALLERTGYTLDVTTGQRKYGGPPPESAHSGAQPTIGTEVQNLSLFSLIVSEAKTFRKYIFYLLHLIFF